MAVKPLKTKTALKKSAVPSAAQKTSTVPKTNARRTPVALNKRSTPVPSVKRTANSITPKKKPVPVKKPSAPAPNSSKAEFNRKIRTQTSAARRQAHSVKRINGSVKNIEIKRRQSAGKQKFYVKKKQNFKRMLVSRLILFFVFFAVMMAVCVGAFNCYLKAGGVDTGSKYTLQLGEDLTKEELQTASKSDIPVTIPLSKEVATRDGTVYLPMSALSEMCNLTVTGTDKDLRYIPRDSDSQSVEFIIGTNIVYVNGVVARTSAPTFTAEGKLYVPVDFISRYADGLTLEVDEVQHKVTVFRNVISVDADGKKTYDDITFKLSRNSDIPVMEEPEDLGEFVVDDDE